MEEIETGERTKISRTPMSKMLLKTKTVAANRTMTKRQCDDSQTDVYQLRPIKKRRTLRKRRLIIESTPCSEDNSAQSRDSILKEVDNWTEDVTTNSSVPQSEHYHK